MSREQETFIGKENRVTDREDRNDFNLVSISQKFFLVAMGAIAYFVWSSNAGISIKTNEHATQLALHAAQLEGLQKTIDQHTTLFAELRRMISDSERSQRADSAKLEGRIDTLGLGIQRHIEADKKIEEMMISLLNDMNLLKAEKLAANIEGRK